MRTFIFSFLAICFLSFAGTPLLANTLAPQNPGTFEGVGRNPQTGKVVAITANGGTLTTGNGRTLEFDNPTQISIVIGADVNFIVITNPSKGTTKVVITFSENVKIGNEGFLSVSEIDSNSILTIGDTDATAFPHYVVFSESSKITINENV